MKKIRLTKGKYALVDDEDFESLNKYKWYANNGYAVRGIYFGHGKTRTRKVIYMHRVINSTPKRMFTDHINGNGLDNRRQNLRTCTMNMNSYNRSRQSNSTSGHKGVFWNKSARKWAVEITANKTRHYLGLYTNLSEAAKAYSQAAIKYHKEFTRVN